MKSAMNGAQSEAIGRHTLRLEQLLTVTKRLTDAISADIAALEAGAFGELKTTDPEIERLCAFYAREVKALKIEGGVFGVPRELVAALRDSGVKLNGLLERHALLVSAMRSAAEGLVHAVAKGVEKARAEVAPYTDNPTVPKRAAAGAMMYNKVI
jgi:hypothetical protein